MPDLGHLSNSCTKTALFVQEYLFSTQLVHENRLFCAGVSPATTDKANRHARLDRASVMDDLFFRRIMLKLASDYKNTVIQDI